MILQYIITYTVRVVGYNEFKGKQQLELKVKHVNFSFITLNHARRSLN